MSRISPANLSIDRLTVEKFDQALLVQTTDNEVKPSLQNRAASMSPVLAPSHTPSVAPSVNSHSPPVLSALTPPITAQLIEKSPEQLFAFIATSTESDFYEFISKPGSLWSLSSKNTAGNNVMHLAAGENQPQVIEKLLKFSISRDLVLAPNKVGAIPLMIAVRHGHADVARSLLSRRSIKPQLHAATMQGDTALMAAAASGNMEIVRLLIDAGSSMTQINAVNHAGCNPLTIACQHGHHAIAALFEMYG